MPIYEYYCKHCDYYYTSLRQIKDRDKEICPICKKSTKRLVSQVNFFIDGAGNFINRDNEDVIFNRAEKIKQKDIKKRKENG